jgi:hypothetical protein
MFRNCRDVGKGAVRAPVSQHWRLFMPDCFRADNPVQIVPCWDILGGWNTGTRPERLLSVRLWDVSVCQHACVRFLPRGSTRGPTRPRCVTMRT